MTSRIRIGAVSYLNTKPLIWQLRELLPRAELVLDLPSRLADALADGDLDVALAPSIEIARRPEWSVISSACIGCRGPVMSVKLLFRTEPSRVATLALDEGSRTSAVLAQLLLAERYQIRPRVHELPIGASADNADADAVLVIGDRAMRDASGYHEAWDLGQQWNQSTGLPFVFAMWVARPGVASDEVACALDRARDLGCHAIDEIAAHESVAMGLPQAVVSSYLRDNLNFHFDAAERSGLAQFLNQAAALGLLSETAPPTLDMPSYARDCSSAP